VHADAQSGVCASSFDRSNQVSRNRDALVGHRKNEVIRIETEGVELPEIIPDRQVQRLPESLLAQAAMERELQPWNVLKFCELRAQAQVN